jgi:hypothetical protein
MKGICVVGLIFFAASSFALAAGIKCEAESYSEHDGSLVVVCPPPFEFSPLRVKMVVGQIDNLGWEGIDLKKPTPVQVMSTNTPDGEDVLVLLPIQKGTHRRLTWRRFRKITKLAFYEEQNVVADERKGN